MNEKPKRFLRGFVVLGNIIIMVWFVVALCNDISQGRTSSFHIPLIDRLFWFLPPIVWSAINIIALCNMPTAKES